MHDLMHDLAESVMRHETYIVEHGKVLKFPKTLHHLSFGWFPHQRISEVKLPINKSLRSLIVHDPRRALPVNVEGFSSFISMQLCLRVLSLNSHRIEKLPDFVWKMEHLRFLTMACQNLKKLPESLTCHLFQNHIESWLSLVCTPPRLKDLTCLQKLSIFIVGQDSAHQIDQLKDLNLGGDLTIRGLEHIRNFEGAKSANLMSKKNLTSLGLYWTKGINQDSAEHFEEVLEGLQPNWNLEKIHIRFYQGSRFPNWMSNLYFNNLKEIILEQCPRCVRLPPLGDVESSFSTLKNLTIRSMPNLMEWTIPDSLESFHCLVNLEIWDCPKLTGLPFLPSLKELMIVSDNNMSFLMSMMLLTSLTCLSLNGFSEIDVLPRGLFQYHNALVHLQISLSSIKTLSNTLDNLSALKSLCVSNCSNLEFIPEGLKHLNSLDSLDICSCDSLTSFPSIILEGSSSLRSLSIGNCDKMIIDILSGPLKKSPTLQVLVINGCPELKYLPENVQQLSGLRNLSIWHCEWLCSLPSWLGSLQLLSEMSIRYCNNLNSLPDSFQSLESLRKIEIEECPILAKRCKKPKGEDWQKISHISEIRIDGRIIQSLDT